MSSTIVIKQPGHCHPKSSLADAIVVSSGLKIVPWSL